MISQSLARLNRQSGKALVPALIIGVLALASGIFVAMQFTGNDNAATNTGASRADIKQLTALQESLVTSLALPIDYRQVPSFELMDVNGEPITEALFEGQWSLAFFGYTHCPDVCPVTLQVMKNVVAKMEEQGQTPPQVVFVSVDPVRDTSADMKQYINYFNDSFIGITGQATHIKELADALGIVAVFTANDEDPENYIVDHTASLLLIDPERRIRAKVTPPHEADKIIADFLTMTNAPS